jgi:RimJ/RimL family protein N-acetyltransferase
VTEVSLRAVEPGDLPAFFAYQEDPESVAMAAFPPRDRAAFDAHWAKILADPAVLVRTVLADGEPAGNVMSWLPAGAERETGYWIARTHWGRGIATRAFELFLALDPVRPLYAAAAAHNAGSQRVLARNGFVAAGEDRGLLRFRLD